MAEKIRINKYYFLLNSFLCRNFSFLLLFPPKEDTLCLIILLINEAKIFLFLFKICILLIISLNQKIFYYFKY